MFATIHRFFSISLISLMIVLTSACGGLSSDDDPELNELEIIDTSGSDSSTHPASEITLNPSENDGLFTLYWDIQSNDEYQLRVFINDRDRISDSLVVYDAICDDDDSCHDNQYLNCEYQSNLDLICEDFDDNESTTDLGIIVDEGDLPQELFFIIEACDPYGYDCEAMSLEVEFLN